ncbi:Mettl5 [Scenedesmus sp. PABB004]|nr:Mettl5 [Scenedesmus sp. PABB004]
MKLKELHALMQDIAPFDSPKPALEQYPTGPDIASRMLYTIESAYGDIAGRVVADLGTGTGMLAIGAALLGSPAVLGVDVDADALAVAQANADAYDEPLPIDFVLSEVGALPRAAGRLAPHTVVMNPPFGTKAGAKGADVAFLRAAAALRPAAIYSLHKTSTRAHIEKVALRELGCVSAEVIAELRYALPATMRFHKCGGAQRRAAGPGAWGGAGLARRSPTPPPPRPRRVRRQSSVDIAVDVWRLALRHGSDGGGSSSEGEGGSEAGESSGDGGG